MNLYTSLCDDFGICAYLNTEMQLPNDRETVLHFFDSMQRTFPELTNFHTREGGEYLLEENKDMGSYRWISQEARRLCAGYMNPPTVEDADKLHELVLDMAPYHLGINSLDCMALDVMFLFDFLYNGNHDEVVAEALGYHTLLEGFLTYPDTKILNFEPSVMLSLDESMRLQCRLHIETRTSDFQLRTNQYNEEPITVYFTVRQYWNGSGLNSYVDSYHQQREICQEMVDNQLIESVLQPLAQTIGTKG